MLRELSVRSIPIYVASQYLKFRNRFLFLLVLKLLCPDFSSEGREEWCEGLNLAMSQGSMQNMLSFLKNVATMWKTLEVQIWRV